MRDYKEMTVYLEDESGNEFPVTAQVHFSYTEAGYYDDIQFISERDVEIEYVMVASKEGGKFTGDFTNMISEEEMTRIYKEILG